MVNTECVCSGQNLTLAGWRHVSRNTPKPPPVQKQSRICSPKPDSSDALNHSDDPLLGDSNSVIPQQQQHIISNLRLQLRSSILFHVHNVSMPSSLTVMDRGGFHYM